MTIAPWWKIVSSNQGSTVTESTANGNKDKTNYCQNNGMFSQCTIEKHDKKPVDCRWFSCSKNSTTRCMFERGIDFEHHCDCVVAQYDKRIV